LRERDEQRSAFTAEWASAVEESLPTLPQRLLATASVVAATTAQAVDPHFAAPLGETGQNGSGAGPAFDLLVLEEAHLVGESELLALAKRARRWALVGEPAPDADGPAPGRKSAPARPAARSASARPSFFHRLWNHLHTDPRRLPSGWAERDGRLVCQLRPIAPEQQQWVEVEHVADRPDIQLRIVAPPRQEPHLAEVLFPGNVPLPEAKDYIYRELEELTVQALGASLCWSQGADKIVLGLSGSGAVSAGAVPVVLEAGVRELVAPVPGPVRPGVAPWHTCCLEFDTAAGWDRERAECWAEERLHLRDLGRTTFLSVPRRSRGGLARFVADLLSGGAWQPGAVFEGECATCAVELVAVPALAREAEGRRGEREPRWSGGGTAVAPRLRSARGGAGLEIDLAGQVRDTVLPGDLRTALPAQGLVNYAEARAVVQALVGLVNEQELQSASADWQQHRHGPCVAVMALYAAQVELIQALLRREPKLAASKVTIEVGLPSAFQQRECLVALVSLTRSHTHRAVSYGSGPQELILALTRPVARLLLFGDLGTLARRSQWQAPLDHLDECASRREHMLLAQLVNYAQGHGSHPMAFRLQESSA
jgi:hypothetical protein